VFGPDSASLVLAVRQGNVSFIVKNGIRTGIEHHMSGMADIRDLAVSHDGRSFAYSVRQDAKYFVIKDNARVGEEYSDIGAPVFSPNGRAVAFVATLDGKSFVINNGLRTSSEYDQVGPLAFSPNGQSLAFWARSRPSKWTLINGGVPVPSSVHDGYDTVSEIRTSSSPTAPRLITAGTRGTSVHCIDVPW